MRMQVRLYTQAKFVQRLTDIVIDAGDAIVTSGEDFGISFQYHSIFSREELHAPIVNVHFSDTEQIRGCNVVSHAIDQGWEHTAVTVHWVNTGVDIGPILDKAIVPIFSNDTAESLYKRCVNSALFALRSNYVDIRSWAVGKLNNSNSYYIAREPFERELKLTPEQERFVRSRLFIGKPKPYIFINGKELEIG